ncbi:Na+/H+ antiporter [Pilimelia anulata]|uniref:Na+/H+ antiporter n=1 Tax=Pilimelia anulata TaxID=53371 RepID=A0A8J3B1C8_9ACTN|nr:Na+/H+ antiporter [Pilimelia anulata]GGJ87358.1 Na+/H+ antiporter [Pilimelia anulata]
MAEFEEIVALVAVVVAVSALARRIGVLAPIALVVVGLGLSLVVDLHLHLSGSFVLVGILPPLLYVAALQISVPAFRFNLRPILLLAVGLVAFTTAAVGFVLHALLPGVPLAICLALGAVVAPPDAVAATAIARRIGLPRRLVTILEGESLLNDATALVLFRVTVAAAVGAAAGPWHIAGDFARAAGGGVLVGLLGAFVMGYLHQRTTDPLLDNTLSLLTPFAVTLVAEHVGASPVVAVVVTGLYLGHRLVVLKAAAFRLQMRAFWKMVTFLLEGLVFLLVGLHLRDVTAGLDTPPATVAWLTAAVVGTAIAARIVWLYPATYLARLIPRVRERDPAPPPTVPALLSWAGMRGVVTLATAIALPTTLAGGAEYPRELFVWLAFATIVVTLVVQGTTLPAVARWLRIPPDDASADLLAEAGVQHDASRAAARRLDELAGTAPAGVVARLREQAAHRSNSAWERLGAAGETPTRAYARLRLAMLAAEREVFRRARDEGRIAEEVMARAQYDMDLEESLLLPRGGEEAAAGEERGS